MRRFVGADPLHQHVENLSSNSCERGILSGIGELDVLRVSCSRHRMYGSSIIHHAEETRKVGTSDIEESEQIRGGVHEGRVASGWVVGGAREDDP